MAIDSETLWISHERRRDMFGMIIHFQFPYIRARSLSHLSTAGIPPAGASLAGVHKTRVLVTQSEMGFDGEVSSVSDQYCSPFNPLMQVGEVLDIVQIYFTRDRTTPLRAHRGKTFNFPTSGDDQSGGDFRTPRCNFLHFGLTLGLSCQA